MLLFSDMVIYAKSVKHQKTGALRLIVYKQAHRSLIDAHDHADVKGKAETGQTIFELQIYNADQVQTLYLRAPSKYANKILDGIFCLTLVFFPQNGKDALA